MIEFIEEAHLYIVDGVILPSVTNVVGWQLGDEYKNIPTAILNEAADYGTRMHKWLFDYFSKGEHGDATDTMMMSIEQLPDILSGHELEFKFGETAVQYLNRIAGTFDLLAVLDGKMTLIDHKTTSKIHTESLEWQTGLYVQAIEQTLGIKVEQCCCLWLPKRKPVKLVGVNPKSKSECDELIERWYAAHDKIF